MVGLKTVTYAKNLTHNSDPKRYSWGTQKKKKKKKKKEARIGDCVLVTYQKTLKQFPLKLPYIS